jgi:hypothetical protein
MRPDNNIITSVLGFDFNSKVTYTNENGEEVELCKGCRSIPYTGNEEPRVGTMLAPYNRFFTNFNDRLLSKIRDYKSKNL